MLHQIKDEKIELNGAVLIIGSLLWDKSDIRKEWRTEYLKSLKEAKDFSAPIRYGKISSSRKCTFTMVFSCECKTADKVGVAKIIEFKNNPVDLPSIHDQALALIKSERDKSQLKDENYDWGWGALGLSINPKILNRDSEKKSQADLLLKIWKSKYSDGFQPETYKANIEKSIISSGGILDIEWHEKFEEIDFFIATAIIPEREYPTSRQIAARMLQNEYSSYFKENIAANIKTYQDKEIKLFSPTSLNREGQSQKQTC